MASAQLAASIRPDFGLAMQPLQLVASVLVQGPMAQPGLAHGA
jgi:hypothetical protein